MNPLLKQVINRLFGDVVRKGITVFGAWLAAKGLGVLTPDTQSNLADIAIGGICIVGAMVWSYFRSHVKDKQISDLTARIFGQFGISQKSESGSAVDKIVPMIAVTLFVTFMAAASTGCAVMSHYDQNSYESAQSLKSQSLALIAHAAEPFDAYADQVAALKVKLSAQLAYEQGKGKNNVISATQWGVLVAPDRDLLGRLLADWEARKSFSKAYLLEKTQQISDGFDQILKLEGAKQR